MVIYSQFPFQFYDFCTKWIEDVDDNDATYAEMEAFQVGTEMNETIARVNVFIPGSPSSNKTRIHDPLRDG